METGVTIAEWQKGVEASQRVVVVVLDASKELVGSPLSAPNWALDHVTESGDVLMLLGVLQQVDNPSTSSTHPFKIATQLMGYMYAFLGTSGKVMRDEAARKKEEIEKKLDNVSFRSNCIKKGVKLYVDVKPGPIRPVTVEQATALRATCVVLDRHMKTHKQHFLDQFSCNIIQMRRNKPPHTLRPSLGPPEQCQEEISIDCKLLSQHASLSHDSTVNPDFNTSGIDLGDSSLSGSFSPETIAHTTQTDAVNSLPEGDIVGHLERQSVPENITATPSITRGDDNLGLSNILVARSNYTGSDLSSLTETPRSSISRASSFSALQVLNSPMDFSVSTGPVPQNDRIPPDSCAPPASDAPVIQSSSLSQTVKVPLISRPASASSFQSFASNPSSYTAASSQTNMNPISVQPLNKYGAYFLGNLLNQEELATDQYNYFERQLHERTNDFQDLVSGIPRQAMEDILERKDVEGGTTERMITVTATRECDLVDIPQDLYLEHLTNSQHDSNLIRKNNILRNITLGPSFLCSICEQRSPEFGKRPISFTYAQLQVATNNFSKQNLLAEGSFGFVYKGLLNGQFIAVKQHKLASTQGDMEFRSEVELLSCAQHRNLVILLGYCEENDHRILVYEYVCNGSLDWHLSPKNNPTGLEWGARQKIAVGSARGLRYLHEECRVGCIIHRDMRPNNILLTHEFEPLVGDFGLARSQQSKDESIETRVIGTFGYLAPEYAQTGQVSWRSDVYSFGVVLLELITGRKAIDSSPELGQHSLVKWAQPLVLEGKYYELLDPRLENSHDSYELVSMVRAASLCIRKDPNERPRMSKVLHILEGESNTDDSPRSGEFFYEGFFEPIVSHSQPLVSSVPSAHSCTHQDATRKTQHASGKGRKKKLFYEDML